MASAATADEPPALRVVGKRRQELRFDVGDVVMCNLGSDGWKLGRVIALHYREEGWPPGRVAPYQVALEGDHSLIYVPQEDPRFCREATREDLNIARRLDALAPPPPGAAETETQGAVGGAGLLHCGDGTGVPLGGGVFGYRDGKCHGCHCCPRSWSAVEVYSEHYRAAQRNGLKITRRSADLGTIVVGALVHHAPDRAPAPAPAPRGFMQCPTLARLPPGVSFSDEGALDGVVRFDPHFPVSYKVEFVAVSTADWDNAAIGLVRLEITFVVEANVPPEGFDDRAFAQKQQLARTAANRSLRGICDVWERWEQQELGNRKTIDQMSAHLHDLRELLEQHPRLDGGWWWVQLGGFHMNVHKLMENTLFECELYLGHALTFGDAEVRRLAEQNLEGCYQKRLLEAARFMWLDGVTQMKRGEWKVAAETLRLAADKKDGWGWGVNNGDIWIAESAARLVHGVELALSGGADDVDVAGELTEAARLLEKGAARAAEGRCFGSKGHPWASENSMALAEYRGLSDNRAMAVNWLDAFKKRTIFWCSLVLGGAAPFPPTPRPRLQDAEMLRQRLLGLNE
mmetsp:Transcript_77932/g.215426  ORF Transcript_77932/g.215426 Transcript_77932/m.215426 type:complete len:572 (-) Transcript_77932:92-1807(-)